MPDVLEYICRIKQKYIPKYYSHDEETYLEDLVDDQICKVQGKFNESSLHSLMYCHSDINMSELYVK